MAEIFAGSDAIITPNTAGEAVADVVSVSNSAFNRIWTSLHVPASRSGIHRPNGMPVGLQVVGPVGGDDRIIALSEGIADALR